MSWGIGKAPEIPLNNDIEALRREMNSDEECRWSDRDTSYHDPHRPEPDADIDYRFDPMAFRFTGEKRSGEVKVVVDPLLQDHGGRAVAEGVEKTLSVRWTGPDSAGPQVSVTGVADGATYRLRGAPTAGCVTVDRGSGVATQATLTLTGGTAAGVGVYTATCAGAEDNEGNVVPDAPRRHG
ncbi:hypothetical protein FDA94_03075 [Herbidospora galbida]|uniref:Uncharacterized protein n=1 Tax=Herbidospora galbida TaxID=2575442 RepID=A0A4V5V028_9ACTN|nr:hypothetical protein [Herbidospora galbida]TKK90763.1 hypothetical protein FDA94_03075 [Herbidospora galbida]